MRDLLHRIGYEYKKPKLVPGNPDNEAQEIFAQQYENFMQTKPDDTEVLFLDAVHPEHNALIGALLAEKHDAWQEGVRYFDMAEY